MIFTSFQKVSVSVICILCVLMTVFGIVNKQSYNLITTDNSAFDNAVLFDYTSFEEQENSFFENLDTEYLNTQLQEADTVFVGTINEFKNQYECLKYLISVDKVVKGEGINKGDRVVLYEYSHFILDENDKLSYFQTITKNLPLISGKQYLIFAQKLEYEKDYQEILEYKEYRIFDAEINTFCLTDNQSEPLNSNSKYFKDFKNGEYICFSEKGLDNMNYVKKEIIIANLK